MGFAAIVRILQLEFLRVGFYFPTSVMLAVAVACNDIDSLQTASFVEGVGKCQ